MPFSRFPRRTLLTTAGFAGAAATGVFRVGFAWATAGPSHYDPTWASVDQHPPAPEWFQGAKFGIYYHSGTWSGAAFGNERYPRNMWISGSAENQHHIATCGDLTVFPFHNFINGARDRAGNFVRFAPKLKSAGGNWDPNSSVNEWNSVARGPRLDLLRPHADAIRGKGLKRASEEQLGFDNGLSVFSTKAILHALIDRVSKGGNMLLNIAPMADGTIPSPQRAILLGMGDHLRRFGESSYATRAWRPSGRARPSWAAAPSRTRARAPARTSGSPAVPTRPGRLRQSNRQWMLG